MTIFNCTKQMLSLATVALAIQTGAAGTAQAQTSLLNYRADAGNATLEKRAATEAVLATTFAYSQYQSNVASPRASNSSNNVFQLTSSYGSQVDGRALVWRQDNTSTSLPRSTPSVEVNTATPYTSQVVLTFSREVQNLKLVFQDIDKGVLTASSNNGGSDYTDEVAFYPEDGAGNPTDITSGGAVTTTLGSAPKCQYISSLALNGHRQVALRGTQLNGGLDTPSRAGNATITFAKPVKTLLLTYRNLNTTANSQLRLQTIGIESISWNSQADLAAAITSSSSQVPAGDLGSFEVSFANVGDMSTAGTAAQVQLPRNLPAVVATNGGTYDSSTGLVTYASASTSKLASYQGELTSTITYRMPMTSPAVQAVASVNTATSEGLNPSPNTATASQERAAPLPVALTYFDATAAAGQVQLRWATATETNNAYFAIERSFDGQVFAQLGATAGHGTTATATAYTYTDASGARPVGGGTLYYRLRQVDLDGTATYSPVRTVGVAAASPSPSLGVYPNPTAGSDAAVTLDLASLPQGAYQASLLSATGATLAAYTVQGAQAQTLPLPAALPAGTYLMLVRGQGVRLTQRLARQ